MLCIPEYQVFLMLSDVMRVTHTHAQSFLQLLDCKTLPPGLLFMFTVIDYCKALSHNVLASCECRKNPVS